MISCGFTENIFVVSTWIPINNYISLPSIRERKALHQFYLLLLLLSFFLLKYLVDYCSWTIFFSLVEKKIALHAEESTNCPQEYEEHLTQCYDGMQAILSAKPNKLGCLQYAEAYRRHGIVSVPSLETRSRGSDFSLDSKREVSSSVNQMSYIMLLVIYFQ